MGETFYCLHCGYEAHETDFRDISYLDGEPVGIQWQCPDCREWSEKIRDMLRVKQ